MVSFIRKRLQIFVSSTYSDLIQERQAAIEAILTAGHIPAGMELFTSGDESQMEVINQWIDESDVYLLILGGRYGSVESRTGKSYIQLEYEYALNKDKPLFACVITDAALEDRVKTHGTRVIETAHTQKLKDFRTLVLTKMVRFWEDAKDIKIAIGETLSHFARRDELIGWVRASQEANMPALADEIARLSKENAQLRSQIARGRVENTIHGLSFYELKAILEDKGLLSFLDEIRSELGSPYGIEAPSSHTNELCVLGLLKPNPGRGMSSTTYYELTDAGRVFLNRLEAQRRVSQDAE
jgi:Domain of unknown function (DUF4062)